MGRYHKKNRGKKYYAVANHRKGWRGDSEGHRRAALGLNVPWSDRSKNRRERDVNLALNLANPPEQEETAEDPIEVVTADEPLPAPPVPGAGQEQEEFIPQQEGLESEPEPKTTKPRDEEDRGGTNGVMTPGVPPAPPLTQGFDIMKE